MIPALFVSNSRFLEAGGGGVQWCTREFLDTLRCGGFNCIEHAYQVDARPQARLRRKWSPQPFADLHAPSLATAIIERAREPEVAVIFLNNSEALALAPRLRALAPELRLVFLSHGVEITDEVNQLRLSPDQLPRHRRRPRWLGELLSHEISVRKAIDGTLCISKEDLLFEAWLGAPASCFIPRTIPDDRLDRHPVRGRIGTVSTLNHIPNLDGISQLATVLESARVRLRVVGGPESVGRQLESRYAAIEYAGRLDDTALREEAATWSAFVNPVFCQARGASTKVATALGWGLPVLTTHQGARGYCWDEEVLPLANCASALAEMARKFADEPESERGTSAAASIACLAPTPIRAGVMIADFVRSLGDRSTK